jgi:uncharacterized protein (DUF1330 family)
MRSRFVLLLASLFLMSAAQAQTAPPIGTPATPTVAPKGYIIMRSIVKDDAQLRQYGAAVIPLAQEFGGRFAIVSNAPQAAEGAPDLRRIVVLEFPSLAQAQAFWSSPRYAEVKKLRATAAVVDAVIVEGRP